MSQEQLNDFLKKMLNFDHSKQNLPSENKVCDDETNTRQESKKTFAPIEDTQEKKIPRKQRRAEAKLDSKMQKLKKNLEAKKQEALQKHQKLKEKIRKTAFSPEDILRIESVLYNRTTPKLEKKSST